VTHPVTCVVSQAPVPVKWMAIESLTHKIYTTKSDVFVFNRLFLPYTFVMQGVSEKMFSYATHVGKSNCIYLFVANVW